LGSSNVTDQQFMEEAHRLAVQGWGRTYPNPLVGAVVVRDRAIVAEGWHKEFGGLHAEVEALNQAGAASRGATLYVTLEPCAHLGKQPPCVDAIVAAGIARVVVAMRDPNPEAAGGIEELRAAGVVVDVGIGDDAIPNYNFRFLNRFRNAVRPHVAIKLAVSMDGMIADSTGNSRWVSGDVSRRWVHWLRAGYGAIAVGARTAVADDARLTVRGEVTPRIPPARVIFDRQATLPADHPVFADVTQSPVYVVVGTGVAGSRRMALSAAGARVLAADSLADALRLLADAGIDSMLVEGGGQLAGAFLREGQVDRIYQIQSPRWLGDGTPAWAGLGARSVDEPRWRVTGVTSLGDDEASTDVVIEMER